MHPVMPEFGYFCPAILRELYRGFSLNNTALGAAQLKKTILLPALIQFLVYFRL